MSRILIVDDEPGIRQSLKGVFEDEGFTADVAASGEECLATIERDAYDVILLDIWLPGIDGVETLRRVRETAPATLVIMISGHATVATAVAATKLGAYDVIQKFGDRPYNVTMRTSGNRGGGAITARKITSGVLDLTTNKLKIQSRTPPTPSW